MRTAIYFGMILLSLGAMIAAWNVRNRLVAQHDAWNATLIGDAVYIVAAVIFAFGMPARKEDPEGFPAWPLAFRCCLSLRVMLSIVAI